MTPRLAILATMVTVDLRALWTSPRYLMLIPLSMAAVGVALWPYVGSPFAPVLAALVFGVEPAFANMLFRSEHDLEAFALLPVTWEDVVLTRNLSTAASGSAVFALMVLCLIYLLPGPPAVSAIMDALLWWGVMVFPLLHMGNELSVHTPRRTVSWTFEDVAEAGVFLAIGGVIALIHPVLSAVTGGPFGSLVFIAAAGAHWVFRSIPGTAVRIRDRLPSLSNTS